LRPSGVPPDSNRLLKGLPLLDFCAAAGQFASGPHSLTMEMKCADPVVPLTRPDQVTSASATAWAQLSFTFTPAVAATSSGRFGR
jgi:hypothetical protein